MTALTPNQTQTLTAFLLALSKQTEPLPAGLQAQLPAIGLNLSNRVIELTMIAASIPNLDKAYRASLAELQAKETERNKGVTAAPLTPAEQKFHTEISNSAVQILTASDPVQAAQKLFAQENNQGKNFWQRLFHSKSNPA